MPTKSSSLIQSLEQLSDRGQKYDLLLKNCLRTEASELLFALAATEGTTLYPEGRNHDLLYAGEYEDASPFDEVAVYFNLPDFRKRMDLRGLIVTMKWTPEQTLSFFRVLIETMRKSQRDLAGNPAHPLLKLARHLLEGEELQSIEKDVLIAQLRDQDPDNPWRLKYWILPHEVKYTSRDARYLSRQDFEAELDPIVDRARELGMSDDEIVDEFLGHLRWLCRGFQTALSIPVVRGLAFAKCFTSPHHIEKRMALLREDYLPTLQHPTMWDGLLERIERFSDLWSASGDIFATADGAFFRPELIDALSRGSAGLVLRVIRKYGYQLNLYPDDIRRINLPYSEDRDDQRAELVLHRLAHEAYTIALEAKRFGVAAGLGQYETGITSKQKLLRVIRTALDLEQSIQLRWGKD